MTQNHKRFFVTSYPFSLLRQPFQAIAIGLSLSATLYQFQHASMAKLHQPSPHLSRAGAPMLRQLFRRDIDFLSLCDIGQRVAISTQAAQFPFTVKSLLDNLGDDWAICDVQHRRNEFVVMASGVQPDSFKPKKSLFDFTITLLFKQLFDLSNYLWGWSKRGSVEMLRFQLAGQVE